MSTEQLFVCRLSNGEFVGNLIGGPSVHTGGPYRRTFTRVSCEAMASQFFTIAGAKQLAEEHGAEDFEVVPYSSCEPASV